MKVGDPALIYRNKNFEYYAFVIYKTRNAELAMHLWSVNQDGETWEYMYFLSNLSEVSVPVVTFNELVGYQQHYIPQGFSVVNQEKTSSLISRYGSIEEFLNYLAEGKWVAKDAKYPKEVRREIIQERVAKQVGKTQLLEVTSRIFLLKELIRSSPV